MLAWLYNDSPVAHKVVVNDRWGKESRHRHGGYYTTEYGAGLPGATHPWEENRGIGHSYGYNRNEDLNDYSSGRKLLLTLIDTVSRGGNLLLNVGPTADGRIPVEMQDRLAYLGQWLAHNGEAIHGTRVFRDGAQWTAGRRQEVDTSTNYRAKYDVEALTLTPAPGDARKEILFTRKDQALYAILPLYPQGELTVRELRLAQGRAHRPAGDTPRENLMAPEGCRRCHLHRLCSTTVKFRSPALSLSGSRGWLSADSGAGAAARFCARKASTAFSSVTRSDFRSSSWLPPLMNDHFVRFLVFRRARFPWRWSGPPAPASPWCRGPAARES